MQASHPQIPIHARDSNSKFIALQLYIPLVAFQLLDKCRRRGMDWIVCVLIRQLAHSEIFSDFLVWGTNGLYKQPCIAA